MNILNEDVDKIGNRLDSNENIPYKYEVYDGEIDMNSNYTGYLEVLGKYIVIKIINLCPIFCL